MTTQRFSVHALIPALLATTLAWRLVVPGVALTLALALAARFGSSEITSVLMDGKSSPVSPVLLGIVFGILWRHFIGLGSNAGQGVQWILGTILRIGIALVGLRLTLSGLAGIGPAAFAVVVACITTALVASKVVGRMLGCRASCRGACCRLRRLRLHGDRRDIAGDQGTASRDRPGNDMVVIGSLGMLTYPWLAAAVLHERTLPVGIFLGTAIHDTSQVERLADLRQQFGAPDVVGYASATKVFRNLSIIILVPLMAWSTRPRMQSASSEPVACRQALVPQFVIWFVVFVLVRTLGDQLVTTNTQAQQTWLQAMSAAQVMSDLFMTCGMTAVGLTVSLTQMHQVGFRPFCAAVIIAAATATCSLGMIAALLF